MARPALLEAIYRIAEPVTHSLGLIIWGIDILQTSRPIVRIYVDVPFADPTSANNLCNNVAEEQEFAELSTPSELLSPAQSASIDQCAKISRMVGLAMEVEEVFASAYTLEVSSPGLSRPFFQLIQMRPYIGSTIEAVLTEPLSSMAGRRKFKGELISVGETDFTVRIETMSTPTPSAEADKEQKDLCIAWEMVRKASRVHIFITPEKPGKKRTTK